MSAAACPSLSIYTNPSRAPDEQVFKPMVISGLLADEGQATFSVPTGGFAYNDRLYMFYITKIQEPATASPLCTAVDCRQIGAVSRVVEHCRPANLHQALYRFVTPGDR